MSRSLSAFDISFAFESISCIVPFGGMALAALLHPPGGGLSRPGRLLGESRRPGVGRAGSGQRPSALS